MFNFELDKQDNNIGYVLLDCYFGACYDAVTGDKLVNVNSNIATKDMFNASYNFLSSFVVFKTLKDCKIIYDYLQTKGKINQNLYIGFVNYGEKLMNTLLIHNNKKIPTLHVKSLLVYFTFEV